MYDFGMEEKEFQLMLDVANEKLELNEQRFSIISDTMRRVRNSGKLDDYTRAQVDLLCNDFSIAIEKLNGKTEYEVAMEEMSGGMMALVTAAIVTVSYILAKILGFFTGSSSSSSGGGGGGGGGIAMTITFNNKAINDTRKNFEIIDPEISYLIIKLEKIDKEICNLTDDEIKLIKNENTRERVTKTKNNRKNIFTLIDNVFYSRITSHCTDKGFNFSKPDDNFKLSDLNERLKKLNALLVGLDEQTETAYSSKYRTLIADLSRNVGEHGPGEKTLETIKELINERAVLIEKVNIISDDVFSDEFSNKAKRELVTDFDEDREFIANIIYKRDDYPNIFNTFTKAGLGTGSEFIIKLNETALLFDKIKHDLDEREKDLNKINETFPAQDGSEEKDDFLKLIKKYDDLIGNYSRALYKLISKAFRVFDRVCDASFIFFEALMAISHQISMLYYQFYRNEQLKKTNLYPLLSNYREDHGNLLLKFSKFRDIHFADKSLLGNNNIAHLVNHVSNLGR